MAASAGHNAIIKFENDPIGAPGVYVDIANMTAEIPFPTLVSNTADISAHKDTVDTYVMSSLQRREDITFEIAYDQSELTHGQLQAVKLLNPPETRRFRFVGPLGVEPTLDVVEIEAFVSSFNKTAPIDEGKYMATVTVRPTGSFIVDGTALS